MSGPNIQLPSSISDMFDFNYGENGQITSMSLKQAWAQYFHSEQMISFNDTRSGTTAERSTNLMDGRWIGMRYFDTTLGKPIFLKSVGPDVWVDGSGAVV